MPKLLDVAVVMRETERAVKLCFWDERKGSHSILWAPKSFVLSECHAGQRDIVVAVSYAIGRLPEWSWVIDDERDEFRATWGSTPAG